MTKHNLSEKTAAMLPSIIQAQGIKNPILHAEETKTLIRLYLYGHREPIVIRKPRPKRTSQTAGKKARPESAKDLAPSPSRGSCV